MHRLATSVGSRIPDTKGRHLGGRGQSVGLRRQGGARGLLGNQVRPVQDVSFPAMRDMVDEFPPERFTIVGVSVDEKLETVVDFQAEESLPWIQWHVGKHSQMERDWDASVFPTYVPIDERGVVLARNSGTDPRNPMAKLRPIIEQAVLGKPDRSVCRAHRTRAVTLTLIPGYDRAGSKETPTRRVKRQDGRHGENHLARAAVDNALGFDSDSPKDGGGGHRDRRPKQPDASSAETRHTDSPLRQHRPFRVA